LQGIDMFMYHYIPHLYNWHAVHRFSIQYVYITSCSISIVYNSFKVYIFINNVYIQQTLTNKYSYADNTYTHYTQDFYAKTYNNWVQHIHIMCLLHTTRLHIVRKNYVYRVSATLRYTTNHITTTSTPTCI